MNRPFGIAPLDSAVAVGYTRNVADCLVHEHHGAMGYHHVNSKYADATVDVEHPEILLYERMPGGQYKLNGVEFIAPYRAWPRDSVAPTLMGQRLRHEDNLKIWYLHVWAWSDNSDGVFADFNPSVQCPPSARKVFTPLPNSRSDRGYKRTVLLVSTGRRHSLGERERNTDDEQNLRPACSSRFEAPHRRQVCIVERSSHLSR